MSDVKLNDVLYRHVPGGGIFKYTVICVRQSERDTQFEVRCETCSHGWKCELLIAQDDEGQLSYVCMLNNDEDDNQAYWHEGKNHFFLTIDEAKNEAYEWRIRELNDKLKKQKEAVAATEKMIKEYQDLINVAKAEN
jgi:hypothetical protein